MCQRNQYTETLLIHGVAKNVPRVGSPYVLFAPQKDGAAETHLQKDPVSKKIGFQKKKRPCVKKDPDASDRRILKAWLRTF